MKLTQLAGTSLAALILATAAQADVTPEEVWADWQASSERWGQEMTAGSTAREGDALVLSDLRIVQDTDGSHVEGRIDRVTLRDEGDGTVAVTMSERYPMTVTTTPAPTEDDPAPKPVTSQVVMTQEGLRILASGDPGAVQYDMTADRVDTVLEKVEQAGEEAVPVSARMTASALRASWTGQEQVDGTGSAETVDLDISGKSEGNRLDADLRMTEVSMTMAGRMGPLAGVDAFLGRTGFAHAASTWRIDTAEGGQTLLATGETGAGTFNYDTAGQMLNSDSETQDVTMHLEGSRLPFPMDLAMASMSSRLSMPATETPTADSGAFHLFLDMRDVTATDETWARVDPKGALPREPAQFTATLAAPDLAGSPVELTDLRLSLAGAELTGKGQVVPPAPDAMTMPRGRVDLTLRGGNALIDRLVAGGILPAEQEMAARMTLGAFGRAVPGQEDTVTSAIQFGNGLSVNGIPLQ